MYGSNKLLAHPDFLQIGTIILDPSLHVLV